MSNQDDYQMDFEQDNQNNLHKSKNKQQITKPDQNNNLSLKKHHKYKIKQLHKDGNFDISKKVSVEFKKNMIKISAKERISSNSSPTEVYTQQMKQKIQHMSQRELMNSNQELESEILSTRQQMAEVLKNRGIQNDEWKLNQRIKLMNDFKKNNDRIIRMQNQQIDKLLTRQQQLKSETHLYNLAQAFESLTSQKRKVQKNVIHLKHALQKGGKQFLIQNIKPQKLDQIQQMKSSALHIRMENQAFEEKLDNLKQKLDEMNQNINYTNQQLNRLTQELNKNSNIKNLSESQHLKYRSTLQKNQQQKKASTIAYKFYSGKFKIFQSQIQNQKREINYLSKQYNNINQENILMIDKLKKIQSTIPQNNQQISLLIEQFVTKLEKFEQSVKRNEKKQIKQELSRSKSLYPNQEDISKKIFEIKLKNKMSYLRQQKPNKKDLSNIKHERNGQFPSLVMQARKELPKIDIPQISSFMTQFTTTNRKKTNRAVSFLEIREQQNQ